MKLAKNGETIEIESDKQARGFIENGWVEVKEKPKKPKEPTKEAGE